MRGSSKDLSSWGMSIWQINLLVVSNSQFDTDSGIFHRVTLITGWLYFRNKNALRDASLMRIR
jgi:hypothetical protein